MRVSCRRRSPRAASRVAGSRRDVGELQRGVARAGAAEQRAQPGAQLLDGERLDEVVVGAGVEPLDAVGDCVARGDDEHRHRIAAAAQRAADLEAADLGHQEIEHDRVGRRLRLARERLRAVLGLVDLVVRAQGARDRRADRRVVVDHEHTSRHGRIVPASPKRRIMSRRLDGGEQGAQVPACRRRSGYRVGTPSVERWT